MKIKYIISSLFVSALFLAPLGVVQAQTATVESLLAELQALQKQVQELQSQIKQTKKEIRMLRADLREGVSNEDVRKIQEILLTDENIYPEKLVTGYYGPLTKAAIRRLQQRFDLNITGEVDEETRRYLEELLQERFGDRVPPGLLRAPGIQKKVELRIRDKCNNSVISATQARFCQKIKVRVDRDKDNDSNVGSLKPKVKPDVFGGQAANDSNNTGNGSSNGDNSSCPADTNFDGVVNDADLHNVNKLWSTNGQTGNIDADVNGDGVVNVQDLTAVILEWGTCDSVSTDSLEDDDDDKDDEDNDDSSDDNDNY